MVCASLLGTYWARLELWTKCDLKEFQQVAPPVCKTITITFIETTLVLQGTKSENVILIPLVPQILDVAQLKGGSLWAQPRLALEKSE